MSGTGWRNDGGSNISGALLALLHRCGCSPFLECALGLGLRPSDASERRNDLFPAAADPHAVAHEKA